MDRDPQDLDLLLASFHSIADEIEAAAAVRRGEDEEVVDVRAMVRRLLGE